MKSVYVVTLTKTLEKKIRIYAYDEDDVYDAFQNGEYEEDEEDNAEEVDWELHVDNIKEV